jgi:nucleoid DNA-binding protein
MASATQRLPQFGIARICRRLARRGHALATNDGVAIGDEAVLRFELNSEPHMTK